MLYIAPNICIYDHELEMSAVRAQGAGGQNVNKVSSAIHLRFDVHQSSLPEHLKQKIVQLRDQRITKDGIVVIKAQQHRTQEKNRQAALNRLTELITRANAVPKVRRSTKPSKASVQRRLDSKNKRSKVKRLRSTKIDNAD